MWADEPTVSTTSVVPGGRSVGVSTTGVHRVRQPVEFVHGADGDHRAELDGDGRARPAEPVAVALDHRDQPSTLPATSVTWSHQRSRSTLSRIVTHGDRNDAIGRDRRRPNPE